MEWWQWLLVVGWPVLIGAGLKLWPVVEKYLGMKQAADAAREATTETQRTQFTASLLSQLDRKDTQLLAKEALLLASVERATRAETREASVKEGLSRQLSEVHTLVNDRSEKQDAKLDAALAEIADLKTALAMAISKNKPPEGRP